MNYQQAIRLDHRHNFQLTAALVMPDPHVLLVCESARRNDARLSVLHDVQDVLLTDAVPAR